MTSPVASPDPKLPVRFFFASTRGDIEMDDKQLNRPFLIAPGKPHPSLTLRDYFHALARFLVNEGRLSATFRLHHSAATIHDIKEIRIRSEKHGAFYHIASIEIETRPRTFKIAASSAVTEQGKRWLQRELEAMGALNSSPGRMYLPEIAAAAETSFGDTTARVMLTEWFDGYHEWHLHEDEEAGNKRLLLWDQDRGRRFLSRADSYEIYRQCSAILTCCFNFQDFRQIFPWRHAAGDFVVRTWEGDIAVRLTTARDYQSVIDFGYGRKAAFTALVYFFLGLSVNMRLDRQDGVGSILWADGTALPAVIEGFFEVLHRREHDYAPVLGPVEGIHALMEELTPEDLHRLLDSLLEPHFGDHPETLELTREHSVAHARELHEAIQAYRD